METQMAWSIKVAAHQAGISERKFRQLILDGKISSVRIGSRRLIRPEAIAEYLEKNTVSAFDAPSEARRILANEKSRRKTTK